MEHLNEELLKHGFKLEERSAKEVFEKIVNEYSDTALECVRKELA